MIVDKKVTSGSTASEGLNGETKAYIDGKINSEMMSMLEKMLGNLATLRKDTASKEDLSEVRKQANKAQRDIARIEGKLDK